MAPPTSRKELQKFKGVINYYRNMWPKRSHTLAPLTKLTSTKRNFKWTQVEQDYFKTIRRIGDSDTLKSDPNINKTFKVNTDASAFQLGAVIIQKGKTITFYNRKLNDSQQWYTETEK